MPQTDEMLAVDRRARMALAAQPVEYRDAAERVHDFAECAIPLSPEQAMAEAARCLHCVRQPCVEACPIGNDVAAIMWYVEHGDFETAARLYRSSNPLAEVCGRICPVESSCEGACVLQKQGKPIPTRAIEDFVMAYERSQHGMPQVTPVEKTGKQVGIIGAGPAGLAAAEILLGLGHSVTLYEAMPGPGGLLVYGIPNFKLDKGIIDEKAAWLEAMGARFVYNTRVGPELSLDSLIVRDNLDAVFVAVGAQVEAKMDVPGEDLAGVYGSLDYLTRANLDPARLPADRREKPVIGRRVAVIGGGDTATDCLRTSLRLGAEDVVCYYRRSEAEMPGSAPERHKAIEEGARIEYLVAPVAALDQNGDGRVDAMRLIRMELGEPDASGRRRPVPIQGSEFEIEVDAIVLAIGFWPDPSIGQSTEGLESSKWGLLIADKESGQTSRPNIFAGGDDVTGPALVNAAVAAAKRSAQAIHSYLMGEALAVS